MKSRLPLIIAAVLGAGLVLAPCAFAQDNTVATVDGNPITEADLRLAEREMAAQLRAVPPEQQRQFLIEFLIQRQLFAAAAEQRQLGAGKDFAERINYARRRLLEEALLEKTKEAVTDADAKQLYDEQAPAIKPEDEVRVRDILVESEMRAKSLRDQIADGSDFATLARAVSADPNSAISGGDLGWRIRSELPDKLADAVFALQKKGDLAAPIQTEAGWHVVLLEDRRLRTMPTFEELKDHIIHNLVKNKVEELAGELRAKASVIYNDANLQPEATAPADASHR